MYVNKSINFDKYYFISELWRTKVWIPFFYTICQILISVRSFLWHLYDMVLQFASNFDQEPYNLY